MMRATRTTRGFITRTAARLKKSGKPTESPPAHKQVYLPYDPDQAPSKTELERERQRFAYAPTWQFRYTKNVEVKDVPENMFTYGKEGMSLPIAIFKDQPDPVIGPEWSYPGIYEHKATGRVLHLEQLFELEEKGEFTSPWQPKILENRVKAIVARQRRRMGMLKIKQRIPHSKDRAGGGKGRKAGDVANPDKAAAAGGKKK